MRGLVRRETMVGWAFFAVGYGLIHLHRLAIDDLLHARAYSLALFPHHLAAQYFFMGFFIVALLLAAGLCFVTAWGVGHRLAWARKTGLMPCLYLLLGFPYLTPIGALGLYYLWKQPTVKRRALTGAEFWDPRRQSGWMVTASILCWFVTRLAYTGLFVGAYQAGRAVFGAVTPGLVAFFLLAWMHVVLHECGHALAAVLAGFRVKVLAIGPFLFSKESRRLRMRFEWRGLLLLGGYMGYVPVNPRRFRTKQLIVVAAGPVTSLLAGGVLLALSFWLPLTASASLWQTVAMGSVIGFYIGAIDLLPLGYSDGTILFHILLRTRRAEELTTLILRGAHLSASPQPARDHEDAVRKQRDKLQQLLDSPAPDPVALGSQYIALGAVEVAAQHRHDAELHVSLGLGLLKEGAAPATEAMAWQCLQILRTARCDLPGATEAYQKAIAAGQRFGHETQDPSQRLQGILWIAGVHCRARNWARTLAETEAALALCPEDEEWRMREGLLLQLRAQALLQTGRVEAGLEAADRAAEIFRAASADAPEPYHLGSVGEALWNAGRTKDAAALVTECVLLLETLGDFRLGAAFRLFLAEILRSDGLVAQAACILPQGELTVFDMRLQYYERRGAIRRSGGMLPEAIADLSAVVAMREREVPPCEVALAAARARLADALAEAGDLERAELLATQARATLASVSHPDFAVTCITLAVIGWRKDGSPGDYVDAALRSWDTAPWLFPADKARELEDAARALESSGLAAAATECRAAAARHWQSLAALPEQEALATPTNA